MTEAGLNSGGGGPPLAMRFSEANYDTEVDFSLLSRRDRCMYGSSNGR